jgi:hypothetical protein
MTNPAVIVPLTGGLGNQLFQYAYSIFLQEEMKYEVTIDLHLGRPRQTEGNPSLLNLSLPSKPTFFLDKASVHNELFTRSYGLILRKALNRNQKSYKSLDFLRSVSTILLWYRYKSLLNINASGDLGYVEDFEFVSRNLCIGYFQTYTYCSHPKVFPILTKLEPGKISQRYLEIKSQIRARKSLLIHIRLTDYLNESEFGIPTVGYINGAIEEISKHRDYECIWIVSDDVAAAKSYLTSLKTELNVVFLDDTNLTDVEVWDLLREFHGYIIANSSFSWWAAFLKRDTTAPVYAPKPWFAGILEPNRLIPPNWFRVNSS